MLLHLQSVEERFHVRIVSRRGDRPLRGMKKLKKRIQLLGQALSLVIAVGKGLSPEVNPAQVPRRGDDRGRLVE